MKKISRGKQKYIYSVSEKFDDYIGKKYGCGSVFVFSTVKRGLLVLMYHTPPVCRELEDESEDSI